VISVTHRYRFSASHRLHLDALSDQENAELYGKCNNPYGHGHDYVLEVTCRGTPNSVSGLIVSSRKLAAFVHDRVLRFFSFRNINEDIPAFKTLVPTTENIALVIAQTLLKGWKDAPALSSAELTRVHVQETDRNGFEVRVLEMRENQDCGQLEPATYA
jgi:6-pyruvoyltetrahydropterin/6-carboxytetrahydropterin synthase